MRDPRVSGPLPQFACDGEGALHTVNRFDKPVYNKWFGGTALAIAYTSDAANLQPNDLTVISVHHNSVWFREVSYDIPAGLPPCPPGGCLCTWNWIHRAGNGEGDGREIYNNLYRCTVTGKTDSTKKVQRGAIPVDCTGNPNACVKGPKTPMYLYQASGNNMPNLDVPPNYNTDWGFANGAQNDIFSPAATPVGPDSTKPTATALPSGWSHLGCYVDQDPRSLPVFLSSSGTNTIQSCVAGCANAGHIYAGVEGNECWCSGPNPTLKSAPASECYKPCGGDGWATCGGDWRMNVYKAANAPATPTPTTKVVATPYPTASLPAGWSEIGCLVDSGTSRTLDGGSTGMSDLTVAKCLAVAASKGLPYAGTQYGTECWVGSAASVKNFKSGDGCNVACGGDKGSICGGSYRVNVYVNNALISSSTAVSTSTTKAGLAASTSTSPSTTTAQTTAKPTTTTTTQATTITSVKPTTTSTSSTTNTSTTTVRPIASSSSSSTTASASPSSTLPAGWIDLGCQSDGAGSARLFQDGFSINTGLNTPTYCMNLCSSKGYKYSGVQYSYQCFCSNTLQQLKPATGCTYACSGDSKQVCGANYRMNVYHNTAAGSSSGISKVQPRDEAEVDSGEVVWEQEVDTRGEEERRAERVKRRHAKRRSMRLRKGLDGMGLH